MSERPETELDAIAERLASVLNGIAPKLPIELHQVDLRILAELCWALGVTPSIDVRREDQCPLPRPARL